MKLVYRNIALNYSYREPEKNFIRDLKLIDRDLDAVFNQVSGKWEIYRKDRHNQLQWILQVENDDETFRPLDNRTIKKLQEMDIIRRFGSVAKYEEYLDEKQKKWKDGEQKKIDHELKCDLRDDKVLWQRAAENFCSGVM